MKMNAVVPYQLNRGFVLSSLWKLNYYGFNEKKNPENW